MEKNKPLRTLAIVKRMANGVWRVLQLAWAAPNSAIGLLAGTIMILSGGKVQIRRGALEFFGGWFSKIFTYLPNGPIAAMTLGHVILGQDTQCLERVREHEQVHVAQYERWGPFFLPAYLLCSMVLWFRGRDAYYENPFEVEAYRKAP